jgi:Cu+-exporting ATPase
MGVLFKNAEAIEVMRKVDTLVVDKTGTLTEGKPKLVSVEPAAGFDERALLRLAATLERGSEHPLAAAIVQGAEERGVALGEASGFESLTGKGVSGMVDGRAVALGNRALATELGLDLGVLADRAEGLRSEGQTVMFVVVDGKLAGLVGVADPIKESTPEAIRALHAEGIRIVMLTGDSRTTAGAVAKRLGIDDVIAEVLPDQKVDAVKRLQGEGRFVAMAGDGINDAPALAQAQVGVAMGTGTDVAMESAPVTLVKGDLRGIVRARHLSRRTMTNIKQNLFFAFFYNAIGVPIAAGVLYPFFGLLLSPIIAAAAMSFSSVSVVGNALRLRRAGDSHAGSTRSGTGRVDWPLHRKLRARGAAAGVAAGLVLVGVYVATLGLANSFAHVLDEASRLWYWMVPLVVGFSLQIGLFAYARRGRATRRRTPAAWSPPAAPARSRWSPAARTT